MVGAHRLPLRFDAELLLGDVREVETQAAWIDHWSEAPGVWDVIPLASSTGDHTGPESIHFTGPGPAKPTALLRSAPHLRAAIADFRTGVLHARLSRLRARTSIHEHRDYGYFSDQRWSFERGFIRVHVPILTGENVSWKLSGKVIDMQPGEAWYLNVCLPHAVDNRSDVDRIHLVVDLEVNDWLRGLFPPESAWDRLRGIALRRLERPLWKLVKPLSKLKRSRSRALPAPSNEVPAPEGQERAQGTIGRR